MRNCFLCFIKTFAIIYFSSQNSSGKGNALKQDRGVGVSSKAPSWRTFKTNASFENSSKKHHLCHSKYVQNKESLAIQRILRTSSIDFLSHHPPHSLLKFLACAYCVSACFKNDFFAPHLTSPTFVKIGQTAGLIRLKLCMVVNLS